MRRIRTDLAGPALSKTLGVKSKPGDVVFVAGGPITPDAYIVARPVMLVHKFEFVTPNLPPTAKLMLARSLMAFSQGWATDRRLLTHGCLFRVDASNDTMKEFARTLGGEVEDDATIFRIDHA